MSRLARRVVLACLTIGLTPSIGHAGPVPVLNLALELWQAIPSASPPVGNASGAVSLNGNPALNTTSQSFSGHATSSASIDIDRFASATAQSDVSWSYVFRVNQPGINRLVINYNYGVGTSVYTNFEGDSSASATANNLIARADVAALHLLTSWGQRTASGSCSTFLSSCGPSPDADTAAADRVLRYSPGFPVGTLITVGGHLRTKADGDTSAGSAEASAGANAAFSIRAVPLPATLALTLTSLLALALMLGRREWRRVAPTRRGWQRS